jgi:hypothetical protein
MKRMATDVSVGGWIGCLRLGDWWLSTFTPAEREYMESVFKPLGADPTEKVLTGQKIQAASQTAGQLLGSLAGWFKKRPEDLGLARRILAKAEACAVADGDVIALHFTYQESIQVNYRRRADEPGALDASIAACEWQITLAPRAAPMLLRDLRLHSLPAHVGFEQLAISARRQRTTMGRSKFVVRRCGRDGQANGKSESTDARGGARNADDVLVKRQRRCFSLTSDMAASILLR